MPLFRFVKQLWKSQPRGDSRRNRFTPQVEAMEDRAVPATLTVLNNGSSGLGSLRQAILDANALPGPDVIQWLVRPGSGVRTIQPRLGGLPAITDSVDIQGPTDATGKPLIVLDGSLAGPGGVDGLRFEGPPSQVRNLVIQNFSGDGIELAGTTSHLAGHLVEGCFIGTDVTGTLARGNGGNGVHVKSTYNLIGGFTPAVRNVISGNAGAGVLITGGFDNTVQGCFIGTDVTGSVALGNGTGIGIEINSSNNFVGGSTPATRNVISGNREAGMLINGSTNYVTSNFIGTDVTGSVALPNQTGIEINSNNNWVGGRTAAERNVISGNTGAGVRIIGSNNFVDNNFIGTDSTGRMALGNEIGIEINASNNFVGGSTANHQGQRNVISGNAGAGVRITGHYNVVDNNFIGTDSTGSVALGNQTGVVIQGGWDNSIGRVTFPNVISGNRGNGVEVLDSQAPSDLYQSNGNDIVHNFIGTNSAGTAAVGNGDNGVLIRNSNWTHVGVGSRGTGNNIAGNGGNGVKIEGVRATNNWVANNYIGILPNGGVSGNGGHGVYITDLASRNRIGDGDGYGNQIVASGKDGVYVESGAANRILYNFFNLNAGLAIDLGPDGVTANDVSDIDGGANNLQNTPMITTITFNPTTGRFRVSWSLNSTPNTSFTIQFFRSSSPSMQSVVGTTSVTPTGAPLRTDAFGNVSGTIEIALMPGEFIAATATGPDGTSELSSLMKVP